MNNDLTFAQQWQAIRNKIDADIQAEGITDLGKVEARVSKNYDSFRDFISNRKKQEALATAYKAGLTPQVVIEGEGGEAKFASYDDKVNDWAELYANQYMAGKKPIDWNTYSTNDRSALIVGTEDAIGRFTHSTEGFLGALGGSFAAMQADLMSRGVFSAQGIPALPPESAEEITNRAFEQGKEITQSAAGEFARTMIPGLSSVAGEDPNAPELKSERIGSAGSPTASAIGQTIGEAAGGAAQSIPLLMIKDPILRAGATLPYFVMGKYQHQNELYKNEMTARETARRLGIPYEPIPYSQRQLAGTVQGLAEYGSEYIGDSLQIGVLKFDKWLLRGLGAKKFGPLAKELGQSMDRHLGPMGLLKTAGKIAFAGATEAGEEAFSESAKGVNIATPAGFEYEYLSEDVADAALTGGLSGAFLGAGTTGLGGIQKAFDDRAIRRQLEEGGAQADMTQSLVERGQQQAVGTFEKRQVISGSKSRNQDLINFNRNIPVVRGQTMARHQIEELSAGNRLAMFVDPVNQKETITPKLKKEMADAGIVKVGTHQGRAVYAHAAFAADVMQVVAQRNSAAINGYNDLNTDQIMAGAVVLRNDAGHIVHVYPYSDPAEMSKRIPSIVADADARGLTVEDVETGKIGTITDQIQRQVDADAALMRMLPEEQRPLRTQDVTKGISTLRTDIAKSIKGGMADPNAKFVYAKTKKPVRNGSVKLRGITLSRVADQSLSDGERKVLETSTGRAVVLDGTAEYEITNDDGTVEVVQGAIPMDGAFVNQSTPDGVFLVRENGNALTSRSAFVVAWHELRHMIHAKSRAGAAHMARLLSIDPVFAARGGAEYMRNRYQDLNGLSDLELIKKLQGLSNAARTTLSSPTATQQQRAEATRDIARFRQFSEESVTTTANQGMGMMTELAAEHEAIYQLRSERSMRAYSAWLANTLVKRGWAGPHARQALYELGQRVRGVRSEEFELHEKFREQTERAAKEAMQQGESRAEAAKGAASAAPAIGAVGASGIGSGIAEAAASLAGEDDEEQQAQPPSDLQTSALQTITDPRLAAIAQMMMAQIAPPSRGISGGPRAQQRERQLRQAEQQAPEVVADEPPSKIDLPLLASIPKPTQVNLRQRTLRNEAQAARVIEGMDPTEELDIGSISRAQRARRYESPSEESLFSVRDRAGRQQENQSVRDLRNRYMQDRGITPEIDITDTYAEVDENFAKRVADWYDSAEVDYADPEMLRAYEAFGKETLDQYKYLRDAGVQMIPWAGTESVQPYANSAQMTRDLRENNRLFYFKTVNPEEAASFGSNPEKFAEQLARNPLLADSGITVLDSEGQPYRQTYNDLFRAVHDVFGHAAEGFQFGPRGEENAYRSHAVMFSPLARGAMATETRSQNSWVNFGPNRRNPDGTVWGEEDPRFQPWKEALNRGEGYADQKPVVTPVELQSLYSMREGYPFRGKRLARGNQAMINRLNQQVSRGKMSQEDASFGIELIERVNQNVPLVLQLFGPAEMRREGRPKEVGAMFDAVNERIIVGTEAIKDGDFQEAFTHELWHSLSRFLPQSLLKPIARDYKKAYLAFRKEYNLDPHDFNNVRIADRQTGKTYRDIFLEETEKRNISELLWYRLIDIDEWLVVNAAEATQDRMSREKEARDKSGPARVYAAVALLIRDMLNSVKSVFGYGVYENLAKNFLRGTTLGMASEPDKEWDSVSGQLYDLLASEEDAKAIRNEQRIAQQQEMAQEPALSSRYESLFDIRKTKETQSDKARAKVRKTKQKQPELTPVQRVVSNETAIGFAPSTSIALGIRSDRSGRQISPEYAQRRIIDIFTSPNVRKKISTSLQSLGVGGIESIEIANGIRQGTPEISARIKLQTKSFDTQHRVANILAAAMMQDAVLSIGLPDESNKAFHKAVLVFNLAEKSSQEIADFTKVLNNGFKVGTVVSRTKVAYVARPDGMSEEDFSKIGLKIASENSVAVDISNAAVQFGDTGVSDESRPKVRSTAGRRSHGFTIAGQRLSDQERDSWLDIASTFAHAAEVEGYEIDYNKWLSAFVADPDERSALQTELVERIVAIDGAAGNYGLSSWYLTKFKGDVKGLIVGPKALVGQDTKDKADEFAVIDKLIAKHPDAFKTLDGYQRFMVEMLQSRTIPIAPESHFKRIADNHAGDKQRFRLISPSDKSAGQSGITRGQLDDAIHGMENAEALRKLYSQGVMKPKHTVLLYLWGFLSRGVSPNVQESLLLDMVNFKYEAPSIDVYKYDVVTTEKKDGKETKREEKTELRFKKPQTPLGAIRFKRSKNQTVSKKLQTTVQTIALSKPLSLDFFIDAAIEGKWSDETDTLWSAFVSLMMDKNAFPAYDIDGEPIVEFGEPTQINGSFGAGAVHNANAFGDNFLRNIATIETINGQTKSGLAHIHDEMSKDTATGDSLRRVFAQIPSALGIDNKVVSFNGLVSGLFGIVADRVFMRLAYNANNELRGNIYDGFTLGWNVFINGKLSEFRFNPELPQDTPPDSQVAPFDSLDEIVKVLDVALGTKPARNFNDTTWDRKSTVESLLKEAAKKKITVPSVQFEAVTHKGIGKLWDGTRGIAIYKAFEESIDLQEAFSELIKQEPKFAPHAHMGMYHWLGWVEDSGQEASHQTVEAIMRMATTGNDRIDSVYAKAGKYNSFQYGFEYGYEVVGTSKSGEQILEPRYKITLPDGKTRQFSTKAFKAFQLALKKPANGVVPKNFMISEQKGPWFNSPQLSETNKANLYRLADEMQTQFSVRAGWDQRQSLMRNMRITSVDPERMSRVAMELPFETIGVPSERLPASLEKIKQAFVDRPVPTPVSPEFIEWNRGNKLVGMVPNNIFWHGTGAQFSRYDERPYELGWHVGSIQQITPFVLQNWANKKSAYAMPLYVTAKNPLRLPDRGSWDMRTIVSSMVKEGILTQEDAVQLMQRMTREVGGELQGSTPLKSFSGRSVSQVSALQRQFTTEWLNSLGYDAIVYDNKFEGAGPDGTNDSVVIWNYGQVKSLSAKQFDPTVPDALFSMRTERGSMFHDANPYAVDAQFSMRRGSIGAKDEFVQQIVDQYDEVLRLQRTIETRTGTALPDASNPYLGMRVLSGRLGSMQQVAERRYATILHDMAKHRITLDMMDDFLTAQHALNGGNQYIEQLTAGRVLDGTGMSNSDANDVILRAQASGRYAQMNRIAEDWRAMLRDALRQRRDSGLITPQMYNTLTTRYTHYVPLQGIANRPEDEVFEQFDEAMRGTGQGQSTTGRGIRRRLGRRSRAMGVTSQVGFMHEETFRRVARNDIGNRFARFVTALNDPNDAEIVRPTVRYVAADGSYQYRPDPSWMQDPRMFGLYVDRRMTVGGHTYQQGDLMVIRLTNPRLATAMKQPKTDIGLVGRGLRHLNDAFRFFTTGMGNPQFAPVNAGRDILTASLMNYTNRGAIDTVQMLARYPFAFARVFKDSWKGRPTGTYAAMQQAGGDMMAWRPNDLELKRIDFDRLAADAQRRDPNSTSVARRLLGWYPAFFSAAETASRLAQFEQRVATGSTKEQAALAAREITVDFAKGGVQKTLLNTLYMFLNAGIQGNANIINSMRRNPRRGAVVASSLVGIGVINAVMARMMAGDDEESGLNRWDMIRNHEKASNLFFFDPRGTGKHIKIPLPYGYNAMVTTGTRIADSVFGPKTGSEAAVDIFTDYLNAFNPIGGSGITSGSATAFNAFVPTAFRPFAEIATNTTFSGAPVYRDSFGKDVVDSATYFDGTPQAYIALAEGLNQFTGGDQYESGSVLGFDTDLSPNVLQYLVGYYFSGTGRLVNQTLKVASGDYSVSDVPLARSFVGQAGTDNAAINELYYEEEAKSLPAMRRAKAAADKSLSLEQRTEAAAGIDPTELRVGISLKETEKALKKLREQMNGATPEQRAAIMKVRQSVMKGALRTRGLTPNQ